MLDISGKWCIVSSFLITNHSEFNLLALPANRPNRRTGKLANRKMTIDFHTHIFPDRIAPEAIPFLEKQGDVKAQLDGTCQDLLRSMDRYGISKSVVCSIATKPSQFSSIFSWSQEIRSERIIPFPSVHPADPECLSRIEQIEEAGFSGIKMHPYYQEFSLDEKRLEPIYQKLIDEQLIVLMHTGFDIAYPRTRLADPARILKVSQRFPDLKMLTSHFGAWDMWDEVRELLIGRPIYMDLSFALDSLDIETAQEMISNHSPDHLLFGSDSPWADQGETIQLVQRLELGEELEEKILFRNAEALLSY